MDLKISASHRRGTPIGQSLHENFYEHHNTAEQNTLHDDLDDPEKESFYEPARTTLQSLRRNPERVR